MDSRYKEALKSLRSAQKVSPAFDLVWTYKPLQRGITEKMKPKQAEASEGSEKAEEKPSTERKEILDSLSRFGQDKLERREEFGFPGGTIAKKEGGARNLSDDESLQPLSREKLVSELSMSTAIALIEQKLDKMTDCRTLFITDSFAGEAEPQSLFECYFKSHVADLFSKMVAAMKLEEKWMLTDLGDKSKKRLVEEILSYKPEVIVTLGAGPTQFLLGTESRLKNIHGQFFQVQQGNYSAKVMPLFSPKLLSTAPNMKKTAWIDMQKVMNELKLL